MITQIFHLVGLVNYVYALWYDQKYVHFSREVNTTTLHIPEMKFFKGKLMYLTIWNMLLQTVLFAICTLNDLVGTNEVSPKKKPLVREIKDKLLACLGFPLSMFVGVTFWAIYFVDRELVFPRALDPFFPVWLNHVMHTNIMLFVLIEMATSFCHYPSRKFGLTVMVVFMASYLVWLHIIHAKTGLWVYPILNVLSLPLRVVFFFLLLALVVILYIVGETLNRFLWSKEIEKISVNEKKKY